MKPSLGRIVLFRSYNSNGSIEHPAIITRVWSDTCVNLIVFLDMAIPMLKSSVIQDEDVSSDNNYAWRWPPRV